MFDREQVLIEIGKVKWEIKRYEQYIRNNNADIRKYEDLIEKANWQKNDINDKLYAYISGIKNKSYKLSANNSLRSKYISEVNSIINRQGGTNALSKLQRGTEKARRKIEEAEENKRNNQNRLNKLYEELEVLKQQLNEMKGE